MATGKSRKKTVKAKIEKKINTDELIPTAGTKELLKEQKEFLKKRKEEQKKKKSFDKDLTKTIRKKKNKDKVKKSTSERRRWLQEHIEKAGFEFELEKANNLLLRVTLGLALSTFLFYIIGAIANGKAIGNALTIGLLNGVVSFGAWWVILQILFWVFIDYKKYQRRLMIEDVLPDFYQLASANIRAGMPIDKALWFAVRPRFGVLAKEIEVVAKRTIGGEDLHHALVDFANKYDSVLVLRSVYLLNEGIKAGGNVGDLLNKISTNLQEMKTMKKEMAANVTTYVIFITFAAIIAGPILFGLSDQLLHIIQNVAENVAASSDGPAPKSAGLSMNMSPDNIKISDFKIFVYTCLFLSSMFSAMIVSTIQKGNAKQGIQYIPIYIGVSVLLYFLSATLLGMMFGGLI